MEIEQGLFKKFDNYMNFYQHLRQIIIIAWLYSSIAEHIFILDVVYNFYILKKPKEKIIFNKIKNSIVGKKQR